MEQTVRRSPGNFMWISIAASVLTIGLKGYAYFLTGSVGLLSDALESFINLAAGILALVMITIAFIPPDRQHPFGHTKAEYFSSITEGLLIFLAAVAIAVTAVERILHPKPIQQLGAGLLISVGASIINLIAALILLKAGKAYNSITLEADAKHLLTDVWTTFGVLAGLFFVKLSGWVILDPVIAIAVAFNILYTGTRLIMKSVSGLMDSALPEAELTRIKGILKKYPGVRFHSLYTRKAGSRDFIFFHLLLPGNWHIMRGHQVTKEIETKIKGVIPDADIFIHVEPLDDPDSFDDYLEQGRRGSANHVNGG